jgi:GTPase SAR1 family protein
MAPNKIALIGSSGVGKTACIEALLGKDSGAEMDRGLNTSVAQSAHAMLAWIRTSQPAIVAVSVHLNGLEELADLKSTAPESLSDIFFVYLFAEKSTIATRLEMTTPPRSPANIASSISG